MPRPATDLRTADRLSAAAIDPGWQKWIDLVELAVAEAERSAWSGAVHILSSRPADAPLLHGATIRLDASTAGNFAIRLARHLDIVAVEAIDAMMLTRLGVERDSQQLENAASRLAVSTDTAAVLGQLCALPLLLNAAGALSVETARRWQRGYCPVCGAWPAIVEMRGIQRERRMRCGGCGSDWLLPVLRCAFCNETDHQKLGSLLSDDSAQHVRIETCATCRGYLKSVTTLGALPYIVLAAKDLSTVTFDLVAHDRGFARPSRPGWPLSVDMVR
jgi:FdhE protein